MKWSALAVGLIFILSCQEAQRDEDRATNTSEDISLAQALYSDAYKQLRIAALNTPGIGGGSGITTIFGCEEITVDTTSDPKRIVIDYKFTGCEGLGVVRFGRVEGEFFGAFGEDGSALDIKFTNYYYADFEVGGRIRVLFNENDTEGNGTHSFYLQDGRINDGVTTMTWTSSQNWVVSGSGSEEVFTINGTSTGVNRKGNIFSSEITNDLVMDYECADVTSGNVEIEVDNISLRTVDYGTGTCDKKATASINGASGCL